MPYTHGYNDCYMHHTKHTCMYNYIATYKQTTSLNLVLSSIKYEILLITCTSELFLELATYTQEIYPV